MKYISTFPRCQDFLSKKHGMFDFFNVFSSCQLHRNGQLFIQMAENRSNPCSTPQIQTIYDRPSYRHKIRSAGQCFKYMLTAADTAVKNDRHSVIDGCRHRRKDIKGCRSPIELTASMIGNPDSVRPC